MRDHLGNTRITFADLNYDGYIQANPGDWIADDPHGSPAGYTEVLQENHYYPFGMNMEGPWREPDMEAKVNRYQYNGKELNTDGDLNWYSYGARMYDPVVCRFTGIDPLAEIYPSISPYVYVANNPILFIDPDGRKIVNGAEQNRQEAEEKYNTLNTVVSNAESKYGTKKEDFTSKKQFKNYKRAKKQLRQAKRSLNHWTRESENTASRIEEFATNSPNMFNELDNLTNEHGETVDVYFVTTNDVEGDNDGANILSFDVSGDDVRPQSKFGTNTIEVQLTNTPSGDRSTHTVTKHEMGHASYNGANAKAYYHYLKSNGYLKKKGYDGHAKDDPSGKRAFRYEKLDDL